MINKEFIFSNRPSHRIKRHVVFWVIWWLYFAAMHAAQPFGKEEISYFRNLPFTVTESVLLLVPHFCMVYYMLYFVCTHFLLKNKYILALLFTLPAWFACALLNMYLIKNVNGAVLSFLLPQEFLRNTERPDAPSFFMGLMNAGKAGMTVSAYAVTIKFIKNWYLKVERNNQVFVFDGEFN